MARQPAARQRPASPARPALVRLPSPRTLAPRTRPAAPPAGDGVARHGVALHAYAGASRTLLLLTPRDAEGPARPCRTCVAAWQHHAQSACHTGPLLAGRFARRSCRRMFICWTRCCLSSSCPRARAKRSGKWAWTSAVMHCGGARPDFTDHPLYWQTGNTPFEREQRHRAKLTEPSTSARSSAENALWREDGRSGDAAFLDALAQQLYACGVGFVAHIKGPEGARHRRAGPEDPREPRPSRRGGRRQADGRRRAAS